MVTAPAPIPVWRITLAFVMALALGLQGMLFGARSAALAAAPHDVAILLCSGAQAPTAHSSSRHAPHDGDGLASLSCMAACAAVAIATPNSAGAVAVVARTALPLAWQPSSRVIVISPLAGGGLGARAPPVAV